MDKTETINLLKRQIGAASGLNAKYRYLLFYYSKRLNRYEIQKIESYVQCNNNNIHLAKAQIKYLNILLDVINKDTFKQLKLNI